MSFADWFVARCNEHGVSPTAVGTAVGVSPASASYWVTGRSVPKKTTLAKIENYFGEKFDDTYSVVFDDELQALKDDERALLHSYRTMTDEQKHMMAVFAKGLKND